MTTDTGAASPWRAALGRWADMIVAADPGLSSLHRATRATLTVICAVFSVYLGLQALGYGAMLTVALLAGIVGLMSAIAVNDPSPAQRKVTMLLLAVVAACLVFLGTVLASDQLLKNLALLAVIFIAFYLRRFGPRFLALGMIAFLAFYFSSLIQTKLQQMPLLIGAIAVGVIWAFVFTFVIFPDRPGRALRRMLGAYYARAGLVLDLLCAAVGAEERPRSLAKKLRRRFSSLSDCAVAIDGQLSGDAVDAQALGVRLDDVRVFTFDALLALETIAASVRHIVSHPDIGKDMEGVLLAALQALRDAFRGRDIGGRLPELTRALDALGRAYDDAARGLPRPGQYALRRVEASGRWLVEDVARIAQPARRPHEPRERETDGRAEKQGGEATDGREAAGFDDTGGADVHGLKGKLQPTTIQAIQATVAGAIGIALGYLLSPSHQYWTVLAAFVVLSNASSIGKTYTRAFQRVAGTLLGAIAGFGLASLVAGSTRIEIVLAFVCVFCAFYLFSISYGLMVFFTTVMLALMYDVLLGGVNAQLLQARFVDTLIGAATGLVMSVLILPTRSVDEVKTSARAFLTSLGDYVGQYLDEIQEGREDPDLIAEIFDLGAKLQQVRAATDIARKASGARVRSGAERVAMTLTALNYYAGHLTDPAARGLTLDADQQTSALLQSVKEGIAANVDALIGRIEGREETDIRGLENVEELIESRFGAPHPAAARSPGAREHADTDAPGGVRVVSAERGALVRSLHYIWHINRAIVDLAVGLGARRPDDAYGA